ncbi:hypothetical protein PYCC9005_005497 [Savitreella phatthalungensis]
MPAQSRGLGDEPDLELEEETEVEESLVNPQPDTESYYHTLNLSRSATDAQIRESHRRLSRLFHPDKHAGRSGSSEDDDASAVLRQTADRKFQAVQRAFEVLSDPRQRAVYDTLGEEGLSMKLDTVGHLHKTADELDAYFRRQARQARVDELDRLVQARGESALSVDARSLFGERVVVESGGMRFGMRIQTTRKATLAERFGDVHFRGMALRHAYTIPFSFGWLADPLSLMKTAAERKEDPSVDADDNVVLQTDDLNSSLTFTGHANANHRKGSLAYGFLATLRHSFSSKTSIETSIPILPPRILKAKIVHAPANDHFYTVDLGILPTLAVPPDVSFTAGRQLTKRGVGFVTVRSGSPWRLFGWGEESGGGGTYVVGFTSSPLPGERSGWTGQLITSLQMIGFAGDYNYNIPRLGIKLKVGGSITTAGGVACSASATRKVTAHSRLGANLTANAQAFIVRLTFSRLGQKFALPVYVGDGLFRPVDSFVWSVVVPGTILAAVEYFAVRPRRRARTLEVGRRRRQKRKADLDRQRQDALDSVELMRDAVGRRQDLATSRQGGLVITRATFGHPDDRSQRIDVAIALAAMITSDGGATNLGPPPASAATSSDQLVIPAGLPFARLTGFYDPCYGELPGGTKRHRTLEIEYLFAGVRHAVTISDKAAVSLPSRAHRIA